MKKQGMLRMLVTVLALVMLLSTVTACKEEEPPIEPDTTTTTTVNPDPTPDPTPDPEPSPFPPIPDNLPEGWFVIDIANGFWLDDGVSTRITREKAGYITVQANPPAEGKAFSHWLDKNGDVISDKFTLRLRVTEYNAFTAVYMDAYVLTFVNGKTEDTGRMMTTAGKNEKIKIVANAAPGGYAFSHWADSNGNVLGTTETITITATDTMTYKAYYQTAFGASNVQIVNDDPTTEWVQGGSLQAFNAFESVNYRMSFAKPYLLKAGHTMIVNLPASVTCPQKPMGSFVKPCSECYLEASRLILKKKDNATDDLANLYSDYEIIDSSWQKGGFTYTATEDVYIMVTVRYANHDLKPANKLLVNEINASTAFMADILVADRDDTAQVFVGDYWKSELDGDVQKIEANRTAIGAGVSEFFFLTDVHWSMNAQFTPQLLSYVADQVKAYNVVNGGGIASKTDETFATNEIFDFNTDFLNYTAAGDKYQLLSTIGDYDAIGGVKGNYGYFDDTTNKVRYIQFVYNGEIGEATEAALAWVEESVNALDNTWTVVLFSHSFYGSNREADIAKRILALQGTAEAEIAAWVTGDIHEDKAEVIADAAGNKLNVIAMNSDSYGNGTGCAYATATEQSFSFVQLDTANQKIYVTRIGAGNDAVYSYGQANLTGTVTYN